MADRITATVALRGGMAFDAAATSGHHVTMDSSPEHGGENRGSRPLELVLMALGGCTGMDVVSILRKKRQEVTDYRVNLVGDRAQQHPTVYTDIAVEHVVRGRGLDPEAVRRAVELSATRYCPTAAMLGKAARVTYRYRVVDEDTGDEQTGEL